MRNIYEGVNGRQVAARRGGEARQSSARRRATIYIQMGVACLPGRLIKSAGDKQQQKQHQQVPKKNRKAFLLQVVVVVFVGWPHTPIRKPLHAEQGYLTPFGVGLAH